MKTNLVRTTEKGQSLVIVVLAFIGLLAALALVLDGGMTFAHRRTAQAAADAGAMAGARMLCETGDVNLARSTAINYVGNNRANAAPEDVVINATARTVEVTAHIPFNTFFAGLIGRPQIEVQADAMVGCTTVSFGEAVLPVAWSCRRTAGGEDDPTQRCEMQTVSEDVARQRISPPGNVQPNGTVWPELYIVMDSLTSGENFVCVEDDPVYGNIICDLDGDGQADRLPSGDRSWLDLDGSSSNSNRLRQYLMGERRADIQIISWLGGADGNRAIIYSTARDYLIGDVVIVPVFDQYCEGRPDIRPECADFYDPSHTVVISGGTFTLYFRVIGMSAFMITCVQSSGQNLGCPGRQAFLDRNSSINSSSYMSIEGYFLDGYIPGTGGDGGIDTGIWNLLFRR